MDINEFMFSRLGLGEEENENEEDLQNLTWGGLREIFALPRDLPKELTEFIIWKHLELQPIRRFFQLQLVCKQFQGFLTVPTALKVHSSHESWMLMEKCTSKLPSGPTNRGDRSNSISHLDTYDVLHKRRQLIPVPLDSKSISSDEVRVSPSLGGECGLIFLEKRNFRSAALNDPSMRRECFAFNPVTKSLRQLPLDSSMGQVDRFGSGYLSWAKLDYHSEEMSPLLFDSLTEKWKRIGSGFTTRGHIRMEKAVSNEVVYLRYGRKQGLTDRLIIYDMLKESFRDALTTGLPENICEEYLFHYGRHIYLATVLINSIRGSNVEKNVVLYELNSNDLNWMVVSVIPPSLLLLTTTRRGLRDLKFIHIDHELLVAILETEKVTDGARVYNRNPRYRTGARCLAIATYDITANSWRRDEADRLGPNFDSHTTVFKPSLDIQA